LGYPDVVRRGRPLVAAPALALALGATQALSGCARNAAFEVELTLPAQPVGGDQRYAVVVARDGEFDFASVAIDPLYPGTALTPTPQQVRYSVLTERPDGHVRMLVFFCLSTDCRDEDPALIPQVWLDFERASYIGQRTRWAGTIDAVPVGPPSTATCVDRCEVEGCIDGQGWFCREDGSHYCQDRGADPGPEVCDP
jgi:hypothetical protein